jgi:hypothetical protein
MRKTMKNTRRQTPYKKRQIGGVWPFTSSTTSTDPVADAKTDLDKKTTEFNTAKENLDKKTSELEVAKATYEKAELDLNDAKTKYDQLLQENPEYKEPAPKTGLLGLGVLGLGGKSKKTKKRVVHK